MTKPCLIQIVGSIGVDTTTSGIRRALVAADGAPVELAIDSQGGFLATALAIIEMLRVHPAPVTARIHRACSAAAVIALAAGHRRISRDGVMVLHRARNSAAGTSDDFQLALDSALAGDAAVFEIVHAAAGLDLATMTSLDGVRLDCWTCVKLGLAHQIDPGDGPLPIRRSRLPAALDGASLARERVGVLAAQLEDLLNGDPLAALAEFADAMPAFSDGYPVPEQPYAAAEISAWSEDEAELVFRKGREMLRRRRALLEAELFAAQQTLNALQAGAVPPIPAAPSWPCAVCGEPNFHHFANDARTEPTRCASCDETIPNQVQEDIS